MDIRGLAAEAAEFGEFSVSAVSGLRTARHRVGGVDITDVRISGAAVKRVGRAAGRYITLEGDPHSEGMSGLVQRAIMQFILPKGKLFAVGLGNPDITHDRLGASVIRSITARHSTKYSLCAVETDVAEKTGLSSALFVRAAARESGADCVIVFDALSCSQPFRIGRTVQITDAGLIPGSGAGASGMGVTRETLGIPVVAVGVPTMTALSSVTEKPEHKPFHITTGDIDAVIKIWAEVLGGAVDMIVGE